jgi:hypothetical protein
MGGTCRYSKRIWKKQEMHKNVSGETRRDKPREIHPADVDGRQNLRQILKYIVCCLEYFQLIQGRFRNRLM